MKKYRTNSHSSSDIFYSFCIRNFLFDSETDLCGKQRSSADNDVLFVTIDVWKLFGVFDGDFPDDKDKTYISEA